MLLIGFYLISVGLTYCNAKKEPWLIMQVPGDLVNVPGWKLVVCDKEHEIKASMTVFTDACEGSAHLLNEQTGAQSFGGYVTPGIYDHITLVVEEDGSITSIWEGTATYPPLRGSENYSDESGVGRRDALVAPGTAPVDVDGE